MKLGNRLRRYTAPIERFDAGDTDDPLDDRMLWSTPVDGEADFVDQFRGVALNVARRFYRWGRLRGLCFDFDDVFQVAWMGVLRAARTGRAAPTDQGVKGTCSQLGWAMRNAEWLVTKLGAHASAKFRKTNRLAIPIDSLDEDSPRLLEAIAAKPETSSGFLAFAADVVAHLRQHDHHREADIMEARLFDRRTLQEVGDALGITRERVRQIEKKAINSIIDKPTMRRRLQEHVES